MTSCKHIPIALATAFLLGCANKPIGNAPPAAEKPKANVKKSAPKITGPDMRSYDWWRKARFGIFIHWGPSSVLALGAGSWQRKGEKTKDGASIPYTTPGTLPPEIRDGSYFKYYGAYLGSAPGKIYDNLYQVLNPRKFNAEEWVQLFKAAGAKYIVFTTKHHDGFCMFNTKYTNYNIMNTPYAKDILKQLTDACHKAGIKVIFYYSKPDWYDPRYNPKNPKPYEDYMVHQIEELASNYGDVRGFWWDGGNKVKVDGARIAKAIFSHLPHAVYNGRGGMTLPGIKFGTPEQKLGSFSRHSPWESCATMTGEEWFWNGGINVKSTKRCLKLLVSAAVGDGNLLLDFGPTQKGTIPPQVRDVYLGMGRWLAKYGESIYATRGGPYKPGTWGGATCAGNNVYLHIIQEWPKGELHLPALPAKIVKASALTGGSAIVETHDSQLIVKLPRKYHNEYDTVIKLTLDRPAFAIHPLPSENVEFVSLNASASASSQDANWRGWAGSVTLRDFEVNMPKASYFGENVKEKPHRKHGFKPTKEQLKKYPWVKTPRDHIWRFWRAKANDKQPWLELDFGKPKTFNKISIMEKFDRIRAYVIQYEREGKWITLHRGLRLGRMALALPKPVTARKVRIKIIFWASDVENEGPGIRQFDVWLDKNN